MKITRVNCRMVTIPYKNPYRMAPGETRHKKQILVLIETDEGITGIGETGVTLIERGGETQEAIYFSIQKYMGPLIVGMDPFDIGLVIDRLEGFNQGRTGFLCAKAGIDTALYDIMGKAIGRPVEGAGRRSSHDVQGEPQSGRENAARDGRGCTAVEGNELRDAHDQGGLRRKGRSESCRRRARCRRAPTIRWRST